MAKTRHGMIRELRKSMPISKDVITKARAIKGDPLSTLGMARVMMHKNRTLPRAPLKIIDEILDVVVMEFARRRVNNMLNDVAMTVRSKAAKVFFKDFRHPHQKAKKQKPRWSLQRIPPVERSPRAIYFGEVICHTPSEPFESEEECDYYKSIRERSPTPQPSRKDIRKIAREDSLMELPEPAAPLGLQHQRNMIEMAENAYKLLSRLVQQRVMEGMDIQTGNVTLPVMRRSLFWGEVIEMLAHGLVKETLTRNSDEIRVVTEFLAQRILSSLLAEMKEEKAKKGQHNEKNTIYVNGRPLGVFRMSRLSPWREPTTPRSSYLV